MSTSINDPESMENARIVCAHCGKEIRYERPHFCPFCGKEIDSTSGLEVASDEAEIYPISNFAPLLMKIFLWYLLVAFIGTAIFGKKALIVLTLAFVAVGAFLWIASAVFHGKKKGE